jgi:hypothetical protein
MFEKKCPLQHLLHSDIKEVLRFEAFTLLCIQSVVVRFVTPCSLLIRSSYISSSTSSPLTVDVILLLWHTASLFYSHTVIS